MRRHHRDGIDVGPLEQFLVVDDEIETLHGGKRCDRVVIDIAARHHLEARACRQAGDDLFAPPAEPDNADLNHSTYSLLGRTGQCGASLTMVKVISAYRACARDEPGSARSNTLAAIAV